MLHVMVDLETMGTRPSSAIIAIGAVKFDPKRGSLSDSPSTFYRNVSLESSTNMGFTVDSGTILWWMQQSEQARAKLFEGSLIDIREALLEFKDFFSGSDYIWGHGAGFDPVLLEHAYRRFNMKTPWRYDRVRDTRTVFDLAGVGPDRTAGVHHDALNDAIQQARAVCKAYETRGFA